MLCCEKCGQDKPDTEFYNDPRRKSGHKKDCKACMKLARRGNPAVNNYDRIRKAAMYEDPLKRSLYNAQRKKRRDSKRVQASKRGLPESASHAAR